MRPVELLAHLRRLGRRRDALLDRLGRSLLLLELWPEVFDLGGPVRSWASANASRAGTFYVRRPGEAEPRTWDLADVPTELAAEALGQPRVGLRAETAES